ncbi:hypothetical protein K469DRAFT_743699 [Zopfia rhizophila CBS 207.26]|uniref:Uncharacterized protein n=1 Tax=Zopfia rhizophila CBS 207.26 TaxID=1314779 RepID=A0A6A6ES87_9PEZI|nr:hypothetical protein K469DRAFT_743699 [Zopfia rhizophila CBS 207.26]
MCRRITHACFFAGVTIPPVKGTAIGVYSVKDDQPRTGFDGPPFRLLNDLSMSVANHLESVREVFVEGSSTIRGATTNADVRRGDEGDEGRLNQKRQDLQEEIYLHDLEIQGAEDTSSPSGISLVVPPTDADHSPDGRVVPIEALKAAPSSRSTLSKDTANISKTHDLIFAKAANTIRGSIEVEGAVFFDASVSSFGCLVRRSDETREFEEFDESDSGDSLYFQRSPDEQVADSQNANTTNEPSCKVLGYATSLFSSINKDLNEHHFAAVTESFLESLLR